MDREEFRDQLHDLGLDIRGFAHASGWSPSTVREWGKPGTPVPRPARVMVGLLKRVRGGPGEPSERP